MVKLIKWVYEPKLRY